MLIVPLYLHCFSDCGFVCWDRQHDAHECVMRLINDLNMDVNGHVEGKFYSYILLHFYWVQRHRVWECTSSNAKITDMISLNTEFILLFFTKLSKTLYTDQLLAFLTCILSNLMMFYDGDPRVQGAVIFCTVILSVCSYV